MVHPSDLGLATTGNRKRFVTGMITGGLSRSDCGLVLRRFAEVDQHIIRPASGADSKFGDGCNGIPLRSKNCAHSALIYKLIQEGSLE